MFKQVSLYLVQYSLNSYGSDSRLVSNKKMISVLQHLIMVIFLLLQCDICLQLDEKFSFKP